MAELLEPFEPPAEGELVPQARLASPKSYAFSRGLSPQATADMRIGRGSLRPASRTRSLFGGMPTGGDPSAVVSQVGQRAATAQSALGGFERPGTRGRFRNVPPAYPSPRERLWDRTQDVADATGMLMAESAAQAGQYAAVHARLSGLEAEYEALTVKSAATAGDIADVSLELAEAEARIHRKELYLQELRRGAADKVTADSAAFRALRNNEPHAKSKHSKFELQRAVAAAEKKLMNWRRSADKAFQEQRAALDKVLQEEQRLETAGAAAVENLEELRAQVAEAEATLESIRAKPSPDAGPFGSFVDTQGNVEVGLDSLSLDIEALDGLAPAARGPALSRLEVRYEQLSSLARELKQLSSTSQRLRADMRLASVMGATQGAAVEMLEAGAARLLLLEEGGCGRLWAAEGGPGEEERVFLPAGLGLTGVSLQGGQLLAVGGAAEADPRFHRPVDAPAPNALVNNMLAVPVPGPQGALLGVLQVHNKRGGTEAFDTRDFMVARLLAEQAGRAVGAGARLHSWSLRAARTKAVAAAGRALLGELDLRLALSALTRHVRDLFRASSVHVYGVKRSPDGGEPVLLAAFTGGAGGQVPEPPPPAAKLLLEVAAPNGPAVARVTDAQADDRFDDSGEAGEKARTRSVMVGALRSTAGAVVGLLQVARAASPADTRDHAFSWEDEEAVRLLCSIASVALANAALARDVAGDGRPVLAEVHAAAGRGLPPAVPRILARLQEAIPCRSARLLIIAEGSTEVLAYELAAGAPEGETPSTTRVPLAGPVKTALKKRRSVLQRPALASTNVENLAAGGDTGGIPPVGPLPSSRQPPSDSLERRDSDEEVLTLPAMAREGAEPVAAVQLVSKVDGLAFTQQDEFMMRGVAAEVAVMVETGQLASESTASLKRLACLYRLLDQLQGLKGAESPGQPAFDNWLDTALREVLPCDEAAAYWLSASGDSLATVGTGAGAGKQPVSLPSSVSTTGQESPSDPTQDSRPLPEQGLTAAATDVKTCMLDDSHSGNEHLFVPVPSCVNNAGKPHGVLHIVGGKQRTAATGGVSFGKADRRLMEDLAANLGIHLDMHAA